MSHDWVLESDDSDSDFEGFENITERYISSDEETISEDEEIPYDKNFLAKNGIQWNDKPLRQTRQARSVNIIKEAGGATSFAHGISSIKECFDLFINDEIKEIVIKNTNMKGEKKVENGKMKEWKNIDKIELEAFFGLLFTSELMHLQSYSTASLFEQNTPFHISIFAGTMSRERFKQILSTIRFDNEETRILRQNDKLSLIREVSDLFIQNCRKMFVPFDNVTIDEQLMPFTGKHFLLFQFFS